MKKKILILIVILIILAGAALAYVALNLNSLIAKFKPDLEKIAADTLGMPVQFGNLEASVFPETKIIVNEFKLGGGSNTQAFKLKNLDLKVNLMPLIFSQKLDITKLTINSPEITISKTNEGIDISGVPKKHSAEKSAETADKKTSAPAASPIAISLNSLEVEDAKVTLVNFVKDKELSLSDIDIDTSIGLEGSIINVKNLTLSAVLLGKGKLSVKSDLIVLNNSTSELTAADIKAKLNDDEIKINALYNLKTASAKAAINSEKIDVEKLLASFADFVPPAVKEFNVKGLIKPALSITTAGSNYTADGTVGLGQFSADVKQFKITDLGGSLNLKADNLKQNVIIPALELSLNGNKIKIETDSTLTFPEIDVTKLVVNAFAGTLSTTGKVQLGTPITFALQNQVSNMQIESAMNALKPGPAMISGTIEHASANLNGKLDESLMQTLGGNVNYTLSNGELKGFNLGGKVLQAVNGLSYFSGSLYERIQGKKELFAVADTVVKKSTGNIAIGGGSMTTKDLYLLSTAYEVNANGRIGFNANLDLKANIMFTPEISEILIGSVKELRGALDEYKRLNIPLAISGTAPAVIVTPNITKLFELGAKSYLRDKAADLLENAIKNKARGSSGGIGGLLGF